MGDGYRFDRRKEHLGDEKSFRFGELVGGSRNRRALVSNKVRKRDIPAGALGRGDGAWQGGARVLVSLGGTCCGAGSPAFTKKGQCGGSEYYCSLLDTRYSAEASRMSRRSGASDFCSQ